MIDGFAVYWMDVFDGGSIHCRVYSKPHHADPMMSALNEMAELRKTAGVEFVSMVSQNGDSVGKPGVDSIVDGKTPDGVEYSWTKRRTTALRNPVTENVTSEVTKVTEDWVEP